MVAVMGISMIDIKRQLKIRELATYTITTVCGVCSTLKSMCWVKKCSQRVELVGIIHCSTGQFLSVKSLA